ncbi:hypothetical protein M758_3G034800 [Ceratodon purpureus]|uniref:Protein Abitram n=1 Tax=Ceratodon purpureus TaxID=3225 RepID=A0A8T0IFG7_CERPU|nr:hypothetical protein KC19_3G035800 [Ceratodon purpureus]KAG0621615.1 hypothetical protein M758_3G034800 [Ceratodon purpureus]
MVEGDVVVAMAAEVVDMSAATGSEAAGAGIGDEAGEQGISAVVVLNESSELVPCQEKGDAEDSLFPRAHELPARPPRAIECNYTHWAALDVGKEFHDQYVYRHANGLCVIGLLPTHAAFKPTPAITAVDFNVGKQNRADAKVSGKRKKNAISLEPNSVLCKVMVGEAFFMIRCCVRGAVLEVNERLIKDPSLLNKRADTEGHIAIMMPRPEDWLKASKTLLTFEQYKERRGIV